MAANDEYKCCALLSFVRHFKQDVTLTFMNSSDWTAKNVVD